jgi:hypothetical protein
MLMINISCSFLSSSFSRLNNGAVVASARSNGGVFGAQHDAVLVAHGRRADMRRWHTTIPCVDGARHGGGGLPEAWHNTVVDVPACVKRAGHGTGAWSSMFGVDMVRGVVWQQRPSCTGHDVAATVHRWCGVAIAALPAWSPRGQ